MESVDNISYTFNTPLKSYSIVKTIDDIKACIKNDVFGFNIHPDIVSKITSVEIAVTYKDGSVIKTHHVDLTDLEDIPSKPEQPNEKIKAVNYLTLVQTNSSSSYDNTEEQKQLVLDILADMFDNVDSREDDIIKGSKNLIYCSVFGQDYYELFKILMESIDITTPNKTFDILVITDTPTKRRITPSAFTKKFNMNYMVVDTPANGIEASKTKCKIFEWEKINDYNKVLFLDSDIVSFKDLTPVFGGEHDSGILYTAYNQNMNFERAFNSKYYALTPASDEMLQAYKINNQQPFNAGQFLFVNSYKMQQHFSNVNWLMNNWPGEYFFEQSFMVQYFCRNFLTNATTIKPYFTIKIITPSQYDPDVNITELTTFIHFAGAALNGSAKIDYIKNFIANHANIV